MPKLLHESQGLKIIHNDNNNFAIVTLHHTADPSKRSPEWKREAAAGMSPEKYSKEYNIDYTATMGAKVFSEITANKEAIIVPEPLPDFGSSVKYWGGLDYGIRNPSSFHIYTIVDGVTYSVWELFEPSPNINDFITKMKDAPYWHSVRYIAADPYLWATTQQQSTGNAISIYELFCRGGVRNLIKGINSQEETWITQIHKHWENPDDITFKIFSRCVNQIREFETAVYTNQSERQLLTQAYQEKIANIDNHSLDDCKYFMLSQPVAKTSSAGWEKMDLNRWGSGVKKRVEQPTPAPGSNAPVRGYY